jgi:hypothetical protein
VKTKQKIQFAFLKKNSELKKHTYRVSRQFRNLFIIEVLEKHLNVDEVTFVCYVVHDVETHFFLELRENVGLFLHDTKSFEDLSIDKLDNEMHSKLALNSVKLYINHSSSSCHGSMSFFSGQFKMFPFLMTDRDIARDVLGVQGK